MNKHTIIIIDDEQPVLDGLRRNLRKLDIEIIYTTSPSHGISLIKEKNASIVISDMQMPEMLGSEVLAQAKKINPNIICMLLTGQADLEAAIDAINQGGVWKYLSKPCDIKNLIELIEEAVSLYEKSTMDYDSLVEHTRTMIHDVRNKLGNVSGFMTLLSRKKDINPEKHAKWNGIIKEEITDITDMFEALMAHAKSGQEIFNFETVNAVSFIENCLPKKNPENIEIIFNNNIKENISIKADKLKLGNSIENFIKNSIEAINQEQGKITVELTKKEKTILLTIKDTGCGMSTKILEKIGTPFFTFGKEKGTGIGFASAKGTVEAHEGSLNINSAVGKGTEIIIELNNS